VRAQKSSAFNLVALQNRPARRIYVPIALAKEIGFEGVDAGHLDASRNIENLGLLVGQLAYGSGFGNRVTLRAYAAS
jgi:predicted dinucleotide-binding enzyme